MCEVTSIALAIQTAMSTYGEFQQAGSQMSALHGSAQAQANEHKARLEQEAGERSRQARRERARMIVAAGESGVQLSSNSFESQLSNNFTREGRDLAIIKKNALASSNSINSQVASQAANIKSPLQIVSGAAASGLQIAGSRPSAPGSLQITKHNPHSS